MPSLCLPKRPHPNKTRIKTFSASRFYQSSWTKRPHPNKTRIKTWSNVSDGLSQYLKDHIPTKQGLRLDLFSVFGNLIEALKDHIPTKQGLRLSPMVFSHTALAAKRPHPNKTRIKTHYALTFLLALVI